MDNESEAPGMHKPNPYAPPEAAVVSAAPQRPPAKKPISAWLVQLLAVAALVTLGVGLFRMASWLVSNRAMEWSWGFLLLETAWRVALVGILGGAVIGTQRRANHGRWLGLVCIAMVFALSVYTQFIRKKTSAPTFAYANQASGESGELLGALLILGLVIWWFYAFGFSVKARNYFLNNKRH